MTDTLTQSTAQVGPVRKLFRYLERPSIFWIVTAILAALAIFTRFWGAADKPFHHDESLHAYYSLRVAQGNPHVYDGMLHGPFLYYCVGLFMYVMGYNDSVAHFPASLFGVAVVLLPLLVRRHIGNISTFVLMFLLLVSPTTMYFGRFLREDVFTSVWVLGTVFGCLLYWKTKKEWTVFFAIAMLAFHFTNKENSYLHAAVWFLAIFVICLLMKNLHGCNPETIAEYPHRRGGFTDRLFFYANAFSIFAVIYILFYSSFFRHPNGSWSGVWDGIYEKSLKYWADQNEKRRIDGPFDYHLPILANYEFLLIPFVISAWYRLLALSRDAHQGLSRAWLTFSKGRNFKITVSMCVIVALVTLFAPRIAFVQDACSYSEICLNTAHANLALKIMPFAKMLHISHSRHLLQIITYCLTGLFAVLAALHIRRAADAFLWFWFVASLGIYSYVGEKVPWLTLYILIPMLLISGLEISRILLPAAVPMDTTDDQEARLSNRLLPVCCLWLVIAIPFTVFKSVRVSFLTPASPEERIVFTQTTPLAKEVRDRWRKAAAVAPAHNVRVAVTGESTWPFAWYVSEFQGFDFGKPTAANSSTFDAIMVDSADLEGVKKLYPRFNIYVLPLRAWWVPAPDPGFAEMTRYFFSRQLYVKAGATGLGGPDLGMGDTQIYYLEKVGEKSAFESLPKPAFLQEVAQGAATPALANPVLQPAQSPPTVASPHQGSSAAP